MSDTIKRSKTLRPFRIVTLTGVEKLTPWFEDDVKLVEYNELYGGQILNTYGRAGGDMVEYVAGEKLAI